MGCLSQNVCTAASAAVAGEGGGARKTEDENQEEGGDQGPPLALGNIDPTYVKKNQSTDSLRLLGSMPHKPHTPGPKWTLPPFLHLTPHTCWCIHSHTTHMLHAYEGHPQPTPWTPFLRGGRWEGERVLRGENKAASLGRVAALPAPHPGAANTEGLRCRSLPSFLQPIPTSSSAGILVR